MLISTDKLNLNALVLQLYLFFWFNSDFSLVTELMLWSSLGTKSIWLGLKCQFWSPQVGSFLVCNSTTICHPSNIKRRVINMYFQRDMTRFLKVFMWPLTGTQLHLLVLSRNLTAHILFWWLSCFFVFSYTVITMYHRWLYAVTPSLS